jgi:hypothetical protein
MLRPFGIGPDQHWICGRKIRGAGLDIAEQLSALDPDHPDHGVKVAKLRAEAVRRRQGVDPMSRSATARHGIAAVTCALTFDDRQLQHVLDDADTRYLAWTVARWLAEVLVHAAAHGCDRCPELVLREAGVRFSEDGEPGAAIESRDV